MLQNNSSYCPSHYLSTLGVSSQMPLTPFQQGNSEISEKAGTPTVQLVCSMPIKTSRRKLRDPEPRPSLRMSLSSMSSKMISSSLVRFNSSLPSPSVVKGVQSVMVQGSDILFSILCLPPFSPGSPFMFTVSIEFSTDTFCYTVW